MAEHNDLGKLGEEAAADYLRKQGYTILERNWRFQKAELDIIALKDNCLAIVEVKTRSTSDFGNPQDFVNSKKIKLSVKAVNEYVNAKNIEVNVRFDVIAVIRHATNFEILHLEDAFYHF